MSRSAWKLSTSLNKNTQLYNVLQFLSMENEKSSTSETLALNSSLWPGTNVSEQAFIGLFQENYQSTHHCNESEAKLLEASELGEEG